MKILSLSEVSNEGIALIGESLYKLNNLISLNLNF